MHFVSIFAECAGLGTPLSLAALTSVSPAPPRGEPSHHRQQRQSWRSGKETGKFASLQSFPLSTGVTWLPLWGSWHRVRKRPVTERGTKKRPLSQTLSAGLSAGFCQLYNFCEKENFGLAQTSRFRSRVIRACTASAGLMPLLTMAFTVCTMGISTW